jgi:hypothetical protein
MSETLKARFYEKFERDENGCWVWTGSTQNSGYGKLLGFDGKTISAHRASWLLHHGDIPGNLQVLHTCDNRSCVNPDHLFLGTASDNMRDCSEKNRLGGNAVPKLTPEQIRPIMDYKIKHGLSYVSVAKKFGMGKEAVYQAAKRSGY